MKRRIAAVLLTLVMAVSCLTAGAETALLADLLCSIDYGDEVTYVIGHKSPDADTIGSAIAYAWLLKQLGINAKAAASAKVNRETQYALDFFGMDQPEIISDAAGKQLVLVDHSEYSQALDGMKKAKTSFEGMTASEIFLSDYKEYLAGEVSFGIGSIYTETEESLAELAKMIEEEFPSIHASGSPDMLFCLVSTDETTWMIWYGEDAEKAVRDSFPEYDGGSRLIFVPKASRKENIVPPLTAALEKWTEEGGAVPQRADK